MSTNNQNQIEMSTNEKTQNKVILNSENDIRKMNTQSANEIKKVTDAVKKRLAVAANTIVRLYPHLDEKISESFEKKIIEKSNIISRKAHRKLSKRAIDDVSKIVIEECDCQNIDDKAIKAEALVSSFSETKDMIQSYTDDISNRITFSNAIDAACSFARKSKTDNDIFLKIAVEHIINNLLYKTFDSEKSSNDETYKKILSEKIVALFKPVIEEYVDSLLFLTNEEYEELKDSFSCSVFL